MVDDRLLWWNGALVPWDAARVHVTSETALRGLNIFEGLRAYWRSREKCYAIVALDEHLDRLENSARLLHVPVGDLRRSLERGVRELLLAIPSPSDLYLRPTIYVDAGGYEIDPKLISVGAFISWRRAEARPDRSLRCSISSWRHIPPESLPSLAKIGASYTAFRLARLEAVSKGFDEAILLNSKGNITETPGGSIFALNGRTFTTPCLDAGILPSITRRIVLEFILPELGYAAEQRALAPEELRNSDAAMIVGTLDEISTMISIDGRAFRGQDSAIATIDEVAQLYHSLCSGTRPSGLMQLVMVEPRA